MASLGDQWVNTLRPEQNDHHFAYNILKCILLNHNDCILIQISLKFVNGSPVDEFIIGLDIDFAAEGNKP